MSPNQSLASILPAEMEERTFPPASSAKDDTSNPSPLPARPTQSAALPTVAELPSPRGFERLSTGNLRAAFRPTSTAQSTVRVVTPEPSEVVPGALDRTHIQGLRGIGTVSPQTSPRSIPSMGAAGTFAGGLPVRRQGLVFNDSFGASFDSASSSPPPRQPSFRPRTRTMDGAFRQQFVPATETRHRVGSFSSGSMPFADDPRTPSLQPTFESYRPDLQASTSVSSTKDKKPHSARIRLTKRPSSRPTSPLLSPSPSVDSLPLPIPTNDANRVLLLMKNLCGRMRGQVEYQRESGGPWHGGMCYIEEERGGLMFDSGENGPFHTPLIPDLRGCRATPVDRPDTGWACLEIVSPHLKLGIFLRPLLADEMDLWLAALLCWQQLRPVGSRLATTRQGLHGGTPARAEVRRKASSPGLREAAIIKVGKVLLWDKGAATSPGALIKRPSTRDLRSPQTSWRRVSCILQDNGHLKLMTENDVTLLSVIELPQLARSAIQPLDRSVLDEDYCIAIFPTYTSGATQLSILRPVYISLESRVLFEVWFVLLRAFTVPDIYGLGTGSGSHLYEVTDLSTEPSGEVFRVEKMVSVRVTEAKLSTSVKGDETNATERHKQKTEHSPTATTRSYLAEVILDGEVRARTTAKADIRNLFWREDCDFRDLPPTLPYLSVLLKRIDGNIESFTHQLQATLGIPRAGSLTEVLCGSADISLHQLERGRDHEQWVPIYDERQQSIGTMLIRVRHEELVVLLSKNYQPLSELLHRFGSGLTTQISAALPGNLRKLAEMFINVFQVTGKATEWLKNMAEEEIDGVMNQGPKNSRFNSRVMSNESMESVSSSEREQKVRDWGKTLQGEANLLFRGNSLLTQSLEFYMRRLGKEYLEETLADKIMDICETNPNCEVDPAKIEQGDDIQQNWTRLINLTAEIWESIAASATRLPPELRVVLKYIRTVAEDRYSSFLRTVTYTSVSGFLFLRFICPAILNPKLFGLLPDHPGNRAQRTLTLIAKGLQALANLSTIGKKETWMEPMNKFISTQRQAVRDFLDEVCDISTDRSTNISVPASYSTPITILGRLSPMAREGFPSLPYLLDHARSFAALVKIWTDVHSGPASETRKFEGDLLEFHNLCLALQQRSAECFAHIESLRTLEATSLASEDPLNLADTLERVTLGTPSQSNVAAAWSENDMRPPGSSGSEFEGHSALGLGKDARYGREARSTRQVSRSSEHSSQGGTVRGLPRKLLSGFIRKTRAASPDSALSPAAHRDRDRDQEREREKDYEKDKAREKNKDLNKGFGSSEF